MEYEYYCTFCGNYWNENMTQEEIDEEVEQNK